MKDSFSIKYSIRFRMVFLLFTLAFLLAFLMSLQSLILLMFFFNMAYIYVMYLNYPALSITNGKVHQHSFNSTTISLDKIEEIIDEGKTITLIGQKQKMVVNKFLFDEKSSLELVEYFNSK